jgi:hypothetical protein
MKKYLLMGLAMSFLTAKAAVITWDGEGADGLWINAVNWTGNVLPSAGDDVILDNSIVTASYTVNLPGGNSGISIRSLLINPQGIFTITLLLPVTNTADPALLVAGTGDALTLNAGAVLKNASGASTGSGVNITGTFRINNGGRYIHSTGRANASIVNQLSAATGTETGVFEYNVPVAGYTISLTGRTYGSMVLSSTTRGGNVSYTGNGSTQVRIRGDLKINNQATLNSGMSADFIVQKNLVLETGSLFNCQNGTNNNLVKIAGDLLLQGTISKTGSGLPVVELNGSTNQHMIGAGAITGNIALRINNAAGITLDSPLRLPYNLNLVNGRIITSNTNLLTLPDNAVCSGASVNSFIEGPVKKEGDDDFTFPVGKGQIYAPIQLVAASGANTTDQFTVEYIRKNPQSSFGSNYPPSENINHISYVEYWDISSNTGSSVSKSLLLTVTCESFCKTSGDLFIAAYDPATSNWLNKGQKNISFSNPVACPVNLAGTITAGPVSSFSHFTLGSSLPFQDNPLPIHLISFNAVHDSGTNLITWEMGEECDQLQFYIERAGGDKNFQTIARINGTKPDRQYSFTDKPIRESSYYYRLKWEKAGEISAYSQIVTVNHNSGIFLSMVPTLISSSSILSFVSIREQPVELIVLDMLGQIRFSKFIQLPRGSSTTTLFLETLPKGIYQLVATTSEQKKDVIRFIKL